MCFKSVVLRKTLFMLSALLAMLADGAMTAIRQTDWGNVAEANPEARNVLSAGPTAWVAYVAVYALLVLLVLLIAGIKYPIVAETGSLFFVVFHGIGAISWFGIFLPGGVWAVWAYALVPALLWFILRVFQTGLPLMIEGRVGASYRFPEPVTFWRIQR